MKILLAEDDPFFQSFYSKKLAERGFEVDIARDGDEAITKIASNTPDVVLLDLIMPVKDGFEVLSEVKKNIEGKKPPIIVFSTLGQNSDIEKALNLGAATYINKTFFDFDNLLSKVTAVVKN